MHFIYNKSWHQSRTIKSSAFMKLFLFFLVLIAFYFLYFGLYGNRGYVAFKELSRLNDEKQAELALLKKQERKLEDSIALLDGEMLDLDFLEERARIILNYSKKEEAIIDFPQE